MKKLLERFKRDGAEGPPNGAAAPQDSNPQSENPSIPVPKPPPELPLFYMLSHLDEDGPVRLDGVKLGVCEVMGLELDEPKLGAFAGALNACDFPVQLLIRQHPPRLGGLREKLAEAQPGNLPPQTEAASESLRRLLTELEARDGILDRRFYAVTEFARFDELRGLLARAGLSVHPLSGRRLRMFLVSAALGGTPGDFDEETPVEVEMGRREVRVGDRLVRSLHLGKWPRSLAPGFLLALMAAGAPDGPVHSPGADPRPSRRPGRWSGRRSDLSRPRACRSKRGRTMSPEAEIALEDVTRLRDEVQRGRERLFHSSLSITLHARDEASLKEMTQRAKGHFAATLGKLDPLAFRQREGILSTLPLGLNAVAVWRTLDTSSLARLFPFSPPDLDTRRGTLYGIDMRACSPGGLRPLGRNASQRQYRRPRTVGKRQVVCHQVSACFRGLTRGVTAYVIDPEGEYADMARAAGGRVLSPGVPGQGMNPFVIDRGDSEELLQRIGSLRRLIEVMVGESLGAERRASLDHALAGYYAQPRERTGFRDFYAYLEGEAKDLSRLLRPFATGSLRNLLSDEGDDLLGNEALVTVFDLRLLEPELRPAAAMVCTETVWAAAAQDPKPRLLVVGRGVEHHAAPRRRGLHGQHGEAGQEAPPGVAVHHPGRPGPPERGLFENHHRTLRARPSSERRLQDALAAGRGGDKHGGRRLRPAPGPPAMAAVVPPWRRPAAGEGAPLPRPHRGHAGGDGGDRVETGEALGADNHREEDETDGREAPARLRTDRRPQ